MIGKKTESPTNGKSAWFTYGTPLVGMKYEIGRKKLRPFGLFIEAMNNGIVQQIWPVGSSGILARSPFADWK